MTLYPEVLVDAETASALRDAVRRSRHETKTTKADTADTAETAAMPGPPAASLPSPSPDGTPRARGSRP
jgi:hypothetical protein